MGRCPECGATRLVSLTFQAARAAARDLQRPEVVVMRPSAKCGACGARIYPDRVTHRGHPSESVSHSASPIGLCWRPSAGQKAKTSLSTLSDGLLLVTSAGLWPALFFLTWSTRSPGPRAHRRRPAGCCPRPDPRDQECQLIAAHIHNTPNTPDPSPNADPTRVPSPALWCPERGEFEYAVPVGAPPCTPFGRSGNAVYRVKRYRGFESLSLRVALTG
jgi:hypothetical protein